MISSRKSAPRVFRALLLTAALCCLNACAHRRQSFHVVAGQPYILRSPERVDTPFSEIWNAFGNQTAGWVDLGPRMVLKIENAYYKDGAPRSGLANFLGTESLSLKVMPNGTLRQLDLRTLRSRPARQAAVSELFPAARWRAPAYRFFFQVAVNRASGASSPVLLSGARVEIEQWSERIQRDSASVCAGNAQHCTVFPEACSVSLGMEIAVNRKPTTVLWGSSLASVVGQRSVFRLHRLHRGRPRPVVLNTADREALRLPLQPGDRISW